MAEDHVYPVGSQPAEDCVAGDTNRVAAGLGYRAAGTLAPVAHLAEKDNVVADSGQRLSDPHL